MYLVNKYPGDAEVAGLWTTLQQGTGLRITKEKESHIASKHYYINFIDEDTMNWQVICLRSHRS